MTIKAEMVQQGGNEFWVVSCISSGGRPDTDISLALNTSEELQRENGIDSDVQKISVYIPATEYEGHNVTCLFDHPKFTRRESQVLTLPSFCKYFTFEKSAYAHVADILKITDALLNLKICLEFSCWTQSQATTTMTFKAENH